jgi:hypothetical protein
MRVIGKRIFKMEQELTIMPTEISIKDNG